MCGIVGFTGAADLLGNDHPSQVVCLCQVESKNFKNPYISRVSGLSTKLTLALL